MRRGTKWWVVPLAAAAAASATAHERDFTLSRDWHLPYAGENEIESRTFWQDRHNELVQQFEYEYGITDHFGFEPGVRIRKHNGEEFELEDAELELRMNFREFGYDKLLPAINLEGERRLKKERELDADGEEEPRGEVEIRSILSWYTREGEDYTINVNVGRGFSGGKGEWESELTAGYVRPINFWQTEAEAKEHPLRAGIEFSQQLKHEHEHFTNLGPVVTWRATKNLHVLGTVLFGLNERKDNSDEFRLILEWEF